MRLALASLAVLIAACSEDEGPFAGLVAVSGDTPFVAGCNGPAQTGVVVPASEVEPHLAIDPTDDRHLLAIWQQDRWSNGGANGLVAATSFDGGLSWEASPLPVSRCGGGTGDAAFERASDPWVAFAADGTAYAAALAFDRSGPANAVLVVRSPDGGRTWGAPSVLQRDADADVFNDKESLTADPADPGRLYAVWDRLTGLTRPDEPVGTGPALMARSTGGIWEPAQVIHDPGVDAQTLGTLLTVASDGTLVVVFIRLTQITLADPPGDLVAIHSTDGGDTWSAPVVIARLDHARLLQPGTTLGVRTGEQPSIASSANAVHVVWQQRLPGASVDAIVLSTSTDGGRSWSAPARVNQTEDAAFTPSIAVTAAGTLAVTYYAARGTGTGSTARLTTTTYLATSADGITFTEEPLTGPFDLLGARIGPLIFVGDYQGLAASSNIIPLFSAPRDDQPSNPIDIFLRPAP